MMLDTARCIARLPVAGIKIHMLYVVKGTLLAELYGKGDFSCWDRDEYVDTLLDFLELLPCEIVVQRLTGDPVQSELLAPLWALEKNKTLNLIRESQERRDTWQGKMHRNSIA
jgi:radical SAM superfamily enzyme